ncbi:hypothetical protein V1478_011530 [Vespula squamosa]|uniref:Uncharacterized protein n=1 Tax=Vespula squamosa TaxID=30214 RepID=A0ABD2AER5_VESSQ
MENYKGKKSNDLLYYNEGIWLQHTAVISPVTLIQCRPPHANEPTGTDANNQPTNQLTNPTNQSTNPLVALHLFSLVIYTYTYLHTFALFSKSHLTSHQRIYS